MVVHTAPASTLEDRSTFDNAKGAFLASLNHEVRTPLSGIVGMLDLLSETSLDEDQREYLTAARLCTESLTDLLNTSLEYAALEGGKITLDEAEFSLRETMEAVVALQQPKAHMKRLRLSLVTDANLPETIVGDATRIRELLNHLLNNGIKFTNTGSVELHISLEGDPQKLTVRVSDTGVGIPPDKLEDIFDSFRQGESGLSRSYPGLGLGLALSRRLVSVMDGEISVASEVGCGSTFTVKLPLRRPISVAPVSEAIAAAPASGPVILAVEDNPIGLRVLRHVLQRRNYNVICATTGREALAAATNQKPDLILMDLQMPDMNGLEAASAIRELPGYESTPILALTANYSDQTKEECLAHGMQAFLSKPVDAHELWSTVSRYLNR
jgi:CheY-like chemotaxis protein/anti-sigma regulatory factor (Ser/Thr protein kinase)